MRLTTMLMLVAATTAAQGQTTGGISSGVPVQASEALEPAPSYRKGDNQISLTFEGLNDLEAITNFYDGGTGEEGSGPGPDLGVVFSDNALAIIDQDAGGTGNFGGEPSPSTIMFFLSNTGSSAGAVMNVADGFVDGFSFFYSAVNNPGSITVYDGVDATGSVLATLNLPVTTSDGGDPTGAFSPLFPIGVSFAGTARSVDFGGVIDQIGFDNITIGSDTPAGGGPVAPPEPAVALPTSGTWALIALAIALAGVAGMAMRR